jgi:2-C-methyl-D-erythritol 4-phosphate cytidylyltransferase
MRMGTEMPKQFLLLAGIPVLMHTIRQFHRFDQAMPIIVALPQAHFQTWQQLCTEHAFAVAHTVVAGGATRFASVKNALAVLPEAALVAVHDGVRPCVPAPLIVRCFDTAAQHGAAVPVMPVPDSIRCRESSGKSYSVPREKYCLVQTPQVFRTDWLKDAYYLASCNPAFTDDAAVVEAAGYPITLTEGCRENIKITEAVDLKIAETYFN